MVKSARLNPGERVLIETLWNVNMNWQRFHSRDNAVLIETLWNVNEQEGEGPGRGAVF